jgi:hypothetical protein
MPGVSPTYQSVNLELHPHILIVHKTAFGLSQDLVPESSLRNPLVSTVDSV